MLRTHAKQIKRLSPQKGAFGWPQSKIWMEGRVGKKKEVECGNEFNIIYLLCKQKNKVG